MRKMTHTISITSGKGGVGKTTLVCNVAYELARQGQKVLILDGDLGMANVDVMFGKRASLTLEHVLRGQSDLEEIIVPMSENIDLIAGGHGVYGMNTLSSFDRQRLMDQVNLLNNKYDYLLIDTAPGIDENVLYLNSAAREIVITVTPDPSSIKDSYALIKVLNQRYRETRFSILANMVTDEAEANRVFQRLSDVANHFLCVSLDYKGFVPMDLNLRQSTRNQSLISAENPHSASSLAIRDLTRALCTSRGVNQAKGGLQFFWQQVSGVA
jgi:flagellar biosynthesis protein FlhG